MVEWRSTLEDLSEEQRRLLLGSTLSQRFTEWSLTWSHPAFVAAFYGFLASLAMVLPFGYRNNWEPEMWSSELIIWASTSCLVMAIIGHFSFLVNKVLARHPIAPPRVLIFVTPFIGLALIVATWMDIVAVVPELFSMILILCPGLIYVHLSWAPRYRLLCMLEKGENPFSPLGEAMAISSQEKELEDAVNSLVD
tara:strand:- start:1086 stop:1670 length:585 start_codon:yes stop_codon:yes gene_type:complete